VIEGSKPIQDLAECGTAAVEALVVTQAWLDQGGPLGPRYQLEVSSPGMDRPLRWHRHWVRFVGREVTAKLEGLGRVRARIVAVPDEQTVVLHPEGSEPRPVPFASIREARLAVDWERDR